MYFVDATISSRTFYFYFRYDQTFSIRSDSIQSSRVSNEIVQIDQWIEKFLWKLISNKRNAGLRNLFFIGQSIIELMLKWNSVKIFQLYFLRVDIRRDRINFSVTENPTRSFLRFVLGFACTLTKPSCSLCRDHMASFRLLPILRVISLRQHLGVLSILV